MSDYLNVARDIAKSRGLSVVDWSEGNFLHVGVFDEEEVRTCDRKGTYGLGNICQMRDDFSTESWESKCKTVIENFLIKNAGTRP
jgi:hypothetical protein